MPRKGLKPHKRTKRSKIMRLVREKQKEFQSSSSVVSPEIKEKSDGVSKGPLQQSRKQENQGLEQCDKSEECMSVTNSADELPDLAIETSAEAENLSVKGRRIIDIEHVLKQLKQIASHPNHCTMGRYKFQGESKTGLFCEWIYHCDNCEKDFVVTSEALDKKQEINDTVLFSALSVGIPYSKLEELFSALDIPIMAKNKSQKQSIGGVWKERLVRKMEENAGKEKHTAITNKHSLNGLPYTAVIGDGGQAQRSCEHRMNSLRGVDNEVESKKRKTTKSAPKKDGRKKKILAAKAGHSQYETCCALACTNTSESCTVVSLPTDPHLREQWLHNIDRQDWTPSKDSVICQVHFEPDLWEEDKDGEKSLKPDAVPTLFLHGETIKSWVTLDQEGNVNSLFVRDGSTDEKKDCDESIDIEESDVYIKQEALEPEIDVMVSNDESSDPSAYNDGVPFQATFIGTKQEQTDDVKLPVITVSSLHSCESETIVPEIVPVVIKSEPMEVEEYQEENEETTSAAVDDTSNDDMESKGWKCTSLGCGRVFRNKNKMQLHAKRKHLQDDNINGGSLVTIKEEDRTSTFGLLSPVTFPTPVGSSNAVTTANWSVLPPHNSPPMVASSLSSTKVITAPINSQTGDPLGTKQYLVMIPTQSSATVGGMTGVRLPQTSLLPIQVQSPTPSLCPSPTSSQITPPLRPTVEQLMTQPPVADSSETFTVSLSQFDERTRVGLKKKILELLDAVEKRKLDPDNLAIVYYNIDTNKSVTDEEEDEDEQPPSIMKRKSGKRAKKLFQEY